MSSIFRSRAPRVEDNDLLRTPQREAFLKLVEVAEEGGERREVGIVLPVGCGKSGCISLAPFAFAAKRALVVAPGTAIAKQLHDDFDPANPTMFYQKVQILDGEPYPEPVEIRGTTSNQADLEEADVVITNIQQLQGQENRWLTSLPEDFFDLILFDEGHHNVATSWDLLRNAFPGADIVNFSATPLRADGQLMAGEIVYSYPVAQAIQEGYVKKLKAVVLNPRTLRYVRREDGEEIEVGLDEVRRLGEEEADFRRSIVSSEETLNTIVSASIRQLHRLRAAADDDRLKIIASALNYEHCRQIVEAYSSRGQRADYVHSREDSAANHRVLAKLENHELDVIVQVRKLGEGFDHPHLAVAAVLSVFSNLSPFIQFVGRIMRVIDKKNRESPLNQGVVVFHAGANVAKRWSDFQQYSEADQEYFDDLLPLEDLDFSSSDEVEVFPGSYDRDGSGVEIRGQGDVELRELPLIPEDDRVAMEALKTLKSRGYTSEEVRASFEKLNPVPVTRVRQRQAKKSGLDQRVRNETGRLLAKHGVPAEGRELDVKRLGKTNFVSIKSALDRKVNDLVGRGPKERHEFTRPELDRIEEEFPQIVAEVEEELFG